MTPNFHLVQAFAWGYVEAAPAVQSIRLVEVLHCTHNQDVRPPDMPVLVGFHRRCEQSSSLRSQVPRIGHDQRQKKPPKRQGRHMIRLSQRRPAQPITSELALRAADHLRPENHELRVGRSF